MSWCATKKKLGFHFSSSLLSLDWGVSIIILTLVERSIFWEQRCWSVLFVEKGQKDGLFCISISFFLLNEVSPSLWQGKPSTRTSILFGDDWHNGCAGNTRAFPFFFSFFQRDIKKRVITSWVSLSSKLSSPCLCCAGEDKDKGSGTMGGREGGRVSLAVT